MSHRKEGHTAVSALADDSSSLSHFLQALGIYLSRHWAWPAIIVLWWFFRLHRNLTDCSFAAFIVVTATVVILGWKQLTANTYWRGYFGILLVFAGLLVFIAEFPILFILFLIALVALVLDLFFVAPHRGL